MNFTPYLSFNGNCQEAMEFYTKLFGAQIDVLRRFSDEESCKDMPAEAQDLVMYAKLSFGKATWLMGSDVIGESYQRPQGVHISVGFDTEAKAREVFDRLAGDGNVVMPLAKTFFSEGFGMVRDRFGISWMVNVNQSESPYY